MIAGSVRLTAVTSGISAVVAASADVFLVRAGRVVTLPLPQDLVGHRLELAVGEVAELPAYGSLSACAPGAGALPPGGYDVYARVVLNPDSGPAVEVLGGPWPISLR